jgi:DNA-binding IclR family transcriptional regulator
VVGVEVIVDHAWLWAEGAKLTGTLVRSAYDPDVATVASPVIDAAGRLVTAAGIVGLFVRSA